MDAERRVVGHPDEVKPALRAMGKVIALRATSGRAARFSLWERHQRNLLQVEAKRRGKVIWDVWDSPRDGGGPPEGVCYGTIVVDQEAHLDGGGAIILEESPTHHAQVILKQRPRA